MIRCVIFDLYGVLYPDISGQALNTVRKLQQQGIIIGAITNLGASKARKIAADLNIKKLYICSELNLTKSEPQIFSLFLKENNLPAEQCLYIDDHERYLQAAKELGIKTVYFGGQSSLADYSVLQLAELLNIVKK